MPFLKAPGRKYHGGSNPDIVVEGKLRMQSTGVDLKNVTLYAVQLPGIRSMTTMPYHRCFWMFPGNPEVMVCEEGINWAS